MKRKLFKVIVILATLTLFASVATPALAAAFTQIPSPDAAYQASTTKIDISGIANFTAVNSISDGTLTVDFSTTMQKSKVGVGWATWSSPPDSENATPDVLWSLGKSSLDMDLSQPVTTFGFEIEPNPFSDQDFDVDFVLMSGPTVVGTINITVNGFAGARLVAASVIGGSFDRVEIDATSDFAIAQVRYAINPTPPGWGKGKKTGWGDGSAPPGLDEQDKTPAGFDQGEKNGW